MLKTGKPVNPLVSMNPTKDNFEVLQIGITKSPNEVKKAIQERLKKRLRQGMVAEVKKLHATGVSFSRRSF